MKKIIILLSIVLLGCSSVEHQRFLDAPENPAPAQVFPGEGYRQTYNPEADAFFLAIRGYNPDGTSMSGPTQFEGRPLRTLDRNNRGFWLLNDEYWSSERERWMYPKPPERRHYIWPYPPYWPPRPPTNPNPRYPQGSSFNGGPIHNQQGFQDNGPHHSGIPGQIHPPGSTHR